MAARAPRRHPPPGALPSVRRFKRAATLVCYFREGEFRCRNYLHDAEVVSSGVVIDVLTALDDWTTLDELVTRLASFTPASVGRALESLVAHALVIVEGSPADRAERPAGAWRQWGEPAAFFHFGTKRAFRRRPIKDELRFNRQRLRDRALPPVVKAYAGAPTVALPPVAAPIDASSFPDVLLRRRTHRAFGRARVALGDVSALLHYTFGHTGAKAWPGLGEVPLRTSPSGGARQPLEAYCAALRVGGLASALYHYRADTHVLERLDAHVSAKTIADWCGHQSWMTGAAAVVFVTAVLPRVLWRYDSPRAYRVLLLETGHFGQTFCLTATWLGLLPFQTAALDDERIERWLGIDGGHEIVVYALGVGAPLESPAGGRAATVVASRRR